MTSTPTSASAGSSADRASTADWLALGGVWAVYASFGLLIGSTAAVIGDLRADLSLTRTEVGVIFGTWQFVYLFASVPAGRGINRFGIRRSLVVAALVIAASALFRSVAGGFWSLLGAVAIFGIGGPLISIGAPKMVSDTFSDGQRRLAVGIYGTGPAVGSALGLALSNSLIRPVLHDSWRTPLIVCAIVSAATGIAWYVLGAGRPEPAVGQPASSGRHLLGLPVVRLVVVVALGAFFFSHALGNWLVEILTDAGWSTTAAGWWAAAPSLVGIVATVALPGLAKPNRRVPMLVGVMAIGAVGVLFLSTSQPLLLTLALVVTGITRAAIMPLSMLVLMDHNDVGPANMALAGGLFFTSAEIGGVGGPALTGLVADASGSFAPALVMLAVAMGAVAVLTAVAMPRAISR